MEVRQNLWEVQLRGLCLGLKMPCNFGSRDQCKKRVMLGACSPTRKAPGLVGLSGWPVDVAL